MTPRPTDERGTWSVLGALNLDVGCVAPGEVLRGSGDRQVWVDLAATAGGTGGNLARHLAQHTDRVVFHAVVGHDAVGEAAIALLRAVMPHDTVRPLVVPGADTGLVILLHDDFGQDDPSLALPRLTLGPNTSAIDLLTPDDVRRALSGHASVSHDLVLDGYLLRGDRRQRWLETFGELVTKGWRIHLELVPHTIWRSLTLGELQRLLRLAETVSTSLSTLERVLGAIPTDALDPDVRAKRLIDLMRRQDVEHPHRVIARFGWGDGDFAVDSTAGSAVLRHYEVDRRFPPKALGDSLFAAELCGAEQPGTAYQLHD
ncbi:MAG: hypothetical protein M3173_00530 [Chloroflexota bacterium]|nr:hypothetical protein [Chloroflexota bacterium]